MGVEKPRLCALAGCLVAVAGCAALPSLMGAPDHRASSPAISPNLALPPATPPRRDASETASASSVDPRAFASELRGLDAEEQAARVLSWARERAESCDPSLPGVSCRPEDVDDATAALIFAALAASGEWSPELVRDRREGRHMVRARRGDRHALFDPRGEVRLADGGPQPGPLDADALASFAANATGGLDDAMPAEPLGDRPATTATASGAPLALAERAPTARPPRAEASSKPGVESLSTLGSAPAPSISRQSAAGAGGRFVARNLVTLEGPEREAPELAVLEANPREPEALAPDHSLAALLRSIAREVAGPAAVLARIERTPAPEPVALEARRERAERAPNPPPIAPRAPTSSARSAGAAAASDPRDAPAPGFRRETALAELAERVRPFFELLDGDALVLPGDLGFGARSRPAPPRLLSQAGPTPPTAI